MSGRASRSRRTLLLFTLVGVIVAGSVLILYYGALSLNDPFSVVYGDSMEPTLSKGDIVILEHVPASQLKVGDIIVFRSPIYNNLTSCDVKKMLIPCYVIHRIVKIEETNGSTPSILLETKGDNNLYPEPGADCVGPSILNCTPAINQNDVLGIVVFRLPALGVFAFAAAPPYNYLLILGLIALVIVAEVRSR